MAEVKPQDQTQPTASDTLQDALSNPPEVPKLPPLPAAPPDEVVDIADTAEPTDAPEPPESPDAKGAGFPGNDENQKRIQKLQQEQAAQAKLLTTAVEQNSRLIALVEKNLAKPGAPGSAPTDALEDQLIESQAKMRADMDEGKYDPATVPVIDSLLKQQNILLDKIKRVEMDALKARQEAQDGVQQIADQTTYWPRFDQGHPTLAGKGPELAAKFAASMREKGITDKYQLSVRWQVFVEDSVTAAMKAKDTPLSNRPGGSAPGVSSAPHGAAPPNETRPQRIARRQQENQARLEELDKLQQQGQSAAASA
jgi:hypothetical protein